MYDIKNFKDLNSEEKELVLLWRNNDNIRKWMHTKDVITLNNHLNFIDELALSEDKCYFLVCKQDEPLGVIYFTEIKKGNSCYFGVYINPVLKGLGSDFMLLILNYAKKHFKVKQIYAEVFKRNDRAISLYENMKFKTIKTENINNNEILTMEYEYEKL